jgi:hypothetical protein
MTAVPAIAASITKPIWVELPTDLDRQGRRHARYEVKSAEVVVYRHRKAYVCVRAGTPLEDVLSHSGVRELAPEEVERLITSYRPALYAQTAIEAGVASEKRRRPIRLGDAISHVTSAIGVTECDGCKQRKGVMNRIVVWGWWRTEV